MKRLYCCLFLFLWGAVSPCRAAEQPFAANPAAPPPTGSPLDETGQEDKPKKFLFLIDVSRSMDDLPNQGRLVLFEMIRSGLGGYMRDGDTYGMWPFNEELYAGLYPMKLWKQDDANHLAGHAINFLQQRNPIGKADFTKVAPHLFNVVSNVSDLVVILVADRRFRLEGTPFDVLFNRIYRDRASQAKKSQQPMVTLMIARNHQLLTGGVTLGSEQLMLPYRPPPAPKPEPEPAEVAAKSNQPAGRLISINTSQEGVGKPPPALQPLNPPKKPIIVTRVPVKSNIVISAAADLPAPSPSAPTHSPDAAATAQASLAPSTNTIAATAAQQPSTHTPPAPESAASSPLMPVTGRSDSIQVAARELNPTSAETRDAPVQRSAAPSASGAGPNPATWSLNGLIWIGAGLFLLGIAVGALMWRWMHDGSNPSIITQSMHYRK